MPSRLFIGLIFFVITVLLAIVLDWQVTDIVWSVWVGSVVTSVVLGLLAVWFATLSKKETLPFMTRAFSERFKGRAAWSYKPLSIGIVCYFAGMIVGMMIFIHAVQASFISLALGGMGEGFEPLSEMSFSGLILDYWVFAVLALLSNAPLYRLIISGKRKPNIVLPIGFWMYNFFILFGMLVVSLIWPNAGAKYLALFAYFLPIDLIKDAVKSRRGKTENP